MSQEKVLRNKEKKRNAKKINAQKKMQRVLAGIITAAICAALVVWIGVSVYSKQNPAPTDTRIAVTNDAIEDYLTDVSSAGVAEE